MLKKVTLPIISFVFLISAFLIYPNHLVTAFSFSSWFNRGFVLGDDSKDEGEKEDREDEKEEKDDDKKEEEKKETEDKDGEKEDEKEKEEIKTEETIKNSDGSQTRIKREINGDEEKVEIKTYNSFGTKINETKIESNSDEVKLESENESSNESISGSIKKLNLGSRLSELSLSTKEGRKIDLKVKSGDEEGRLKYNPEDGSLVVTRKVEKEGEVEGKEEEVEIESRGDGFELKSKGSLAHINFPILIDEVTGDIYVDTPSGQVLLKTMPDSILEKVNVNRELFTVDSMEIDVLGAGDENGAVSKLEYKVRGTKIEKLLGLFRVSVAEQINLDAQTGEVISSTSSSLASKLLDFFSF